MGVTCQLAWSNWLGIEVEVFGKVLHDFIAELGGLQTGSILLEHGQQGHDLGGHLLLDEEGLYDVVGVTVVEEVEQEGRVFRE